MSLYTKYISDRDRQTHRVSDHKHTCGLCLSYAEIRVTGSISHSVCLGVDVQGISPLIVAHLRSLCAHVMLCESVSVRICKCSPRDEESLGKDKLFWDHRSPS